MRLEGCARNLELKQALESGQWPLACSGELRSHVDACPSCSQQVLLSTAFRQDRSLSMAAARVGSPGLIWWRAQLRRRNLAVERITRPLLGAQIFALAVMGLAALGFLGFELRQKQDWHGVWSGFLHSASDHLALLTPGSTGGWMLPAALLTALALAGGLVAYFSVDRN